MSGLYLPQCQAPAHRSQFNKEHTVSNDILFCWINEKKKAIPREPLDIFQVTNEVNLLKKLVPLFFWDYSMITLPISFLPSHISLLAQIHWSQFTFSLEIFHVYFLIYWHSKPEPRGRGDGIEFEGHIWGSRKQEIFQDKRGKAVALYTLTPVLWRISASMFTNFNTHASESGVTEQIKTIKGPTMTEKTDASPKNTWKF